MDAPMYIAVLKEPAAHCEQPADVSKNESVLKVPDAQAEQLDDLVRPMNAEYDGAVMVVKEPAGQPEQPMLVLTYTLVLKVPTAHSVHEGAVPSEYVPARHDVQATAPVVREEYCPGGQLWQEPMAPPGVDLKVPSGHAVHTDDEDAAATVL